MSALDRYGGDAAWDLHCMRAEAYEESVLRHATCGDCRHCARMRRFAELRGYGWCDVEGEAVRLDERGPADGCEEFDAA